MSDPERFRQEWIPEEEGGAAERVARQRDVFKAAAQRDQAGLLRLLEDRTAYPMAAALLIAAKDPDGSVLRALLATLDNRNLSAEHRAMVLQRLLMDRRVEPDLWIRWALQRPEWLFRRIGVGMSFDATVGMTLSRAIPFVIPMLDDPIDGVREFAWELLKTRTGHSELGPDAWAWSEWWRQDGEAWARSRER